MMSPDPTHDASGFSHLSDTKVVGRSGLPERNARNNHDLIHRTREFLRHHRFNRTRDRFLVGMDVLRQDAVRPHNRQSRRRDTAWSGVIARISTDGRLRAMRAAVVPLDVNAAIAGS